MLPRAWRKDDHTNLSPRKCRHFISSQTKSRWWVMSLSLPGDLTDSQGIIKQFQSAEESEERGGGWEWGAGTAHTHTDTHNREQINHDFFFFLEDGVMMELSGLTRWLQRWNYTVIKHMYNKGFVFVFVVFFCLPRKKHKNCGRLLASSLPAWSYLIGLAGFWIWWLKINTHWRKRDTWRESQ